MRTEFFDSLVQCKTRRLSRDFKENTAGFTEINGMKIRAIDYRRDVVAKVDETLAPLKLFGLIPCPKGNVMHRTGGDATHRSVWLAQQVNDPPYRRVIRREEAESISRFINQTIAEGLGE